MGGGARDYGVGAGRACCQRSCNSGGENEAGADLDLAGVGNPAIGGEEFGPSIAVAEDLLGQLPEGIAAADANGCWNAESGRRERSLSRMWENGFGWRDRLKRHDGFTRRGGLRRLGENGWFGGP